MPARFSWPCAADRRRRQGRLERLLAPSDLNWTVLSPATLSEPGPCPGQFRLGGDQLLMDAEGNSRISVPDYAVAMLDELEQPRHINRRFTLVC